MTEKQAAEFGKAVGDVTRQRILRFCCCTRRSVGEIAKNAKVTQPTATHHLSILEKAKLVHRDQEGKTVFYHVNQDRMVSCCGQLMVKLAPEQEATELVKSCCC